MFNASKAICICLCLTSFMLSTRLSPGQESSDAQAAAEIPEAEKPFWENAQAFVESYAKRDTAAIGQLFTEDAEFYDEFGELTQGRAAIEEAFSGVFEASPEAMVDEIDLQRVRFVTGDVALEEGVTITTESPSAAPQSSRYVALHLKGDDGVWRINTLKSHGQEQGGRAEHLDQLIWLVGDWMNEDEESVVQTTCRWSDDGNYLLRSFNIEREGESIMNGVQRIGWDPLRRQLRSWTFDSEGGFIEGTWLRNGNQWVVTSSGVSSDGEPATGTAVYTIVDAEMVTWQYRNLVIGTELREDIEPVVMVRRPPAPATAATE